jgi:hypothetical protein
MKFIIALVLTALSGYLLPIFLPWWSFAITSFFIAVFIHQRPWKAFLAGFIALLLLWGIYASIIDNANQHILSTKVAQILPFKGSYMALIITTAIIGGLLSGMAALSGSYLYQGKEREQRRKRRRFRY